MNPLLVTLGGYAFAFGMIWLLLRHEYRMPKIASVSLGTAVVAFGFGVAFAGHLLGFGPIPQLSGASSSVMFVMALGIAIVG